MAYEGIPHICICGTITWEERASGMLGPPSLSPCDCATWGKYEGNPHMQYDLHFSLIYIYFYIYIFIYIYIYIYLFNIYKLFFIIFFFIYLFIINIIYFLLYIFTHLTSPSFYIYIYLI